MDYDGYPEDADLQTIRDWPYQNGFTGLMDYIRSIWRYDSIEQSGRSYRISSYGWSGNESIIGAMQDNRMFWMTCWRSSRRGGHYEFEIPEFLMAAKPVEPSQKRTEA